MAFVYWIRAPHHTNIFTEGYVGFTSTTVSDRLRTHRSDSKRPRYQHYPVYRAMQKYGDDIVIETVLEGSNDYCLEVEYKLRPSAKIGWNLNVGGEAGTLGTKASVETRCRQSEAHKGEKNHFYGRTHSEETKKKISDNRKGKDVWTNERRAKHSEARAGKKMNLSPEQRAKRSSNARSRKHTESSKAKLSDSRKLLNLVKWKAHRANKDLWAVADKAFDFIAANPDAGERKLTMAVLGRGVQCKDLLRMLREGWNPRLDQDWLDFKENYERGADGDQAE